MDDSTDIPGIGYGYRICTCECHKAGVDVRHCVPCCDKTYMKYTDELWASIPELQDAMYRARARMERIKVKGLDNEKG